MIPLIRTLDQIKGVARRPNQWQRPERIEVIKVALRQLEILERAGKVEREEFVTLRAQLLRMKSQEAYLWARSQRKSTQPTQTTPTSMPSG